MTQFKPKKIAKGKVIGFVICKFGLLPCENEFDIEELKKFALIYDAGVKRGTIIQHNFSPQPTWRNPSEAEEIAMNMVVKHGLKNLHLYSAPNEISELLKILKNSLSYRFGNRYFKIEKINKIKKRLKL